MTENLSEKHPENESHTMSEAVQKIKWYKTALFKTVFFSFIWAIGFAALLPLGTISAWQYSFFIGSVPSTLIWDNFNIQNTLSMVLLALLNAAVLMLPYLYYRVYQAQHWWLYASFSLYGFINASLGFTIIISVRGLAGH